MRDLDGRSRLRSAAARRWRRSRSPSGSRCRRRESARTWRRAPRRPAGPTANPRPSAASYNRTAAVAPPRAERDDHRQRRGDEQGVAEAPAAAEQRPARSRNWRFPTRRRRRRPGRRRAASWRGRRCRLETKPAISIISAVIGEVAGEQQRNLRRAWRAARLGDRRQDRIDHADAHEADDAGEEGGPDRPGLAQEGERDRRRGGKGVHAVGFRDRAPMAAEKHRRAHNQASAAL